MFLTALIVSKGKFHVLTEFGALQEVYRTTNQRVSEALLQKRLRISARAVVSVSSSALKFLPYFKSTLTLS